MHKHTNTTSVITTSVITPRGPYQLEGAKRHLLAMVFSNSASFETNLHSELRLQVRLDENPKIRSFSFQVLCKASEFFGANLNLHWRDRSHTPPFFRNARRGAKTAWGVLDDCPGTPIIVNWSGLDPLEQAEISLTTLVSKDNWIIFTHTLGPEKTNTPLMPTGAQRILHTKGSASRERRWWRTGEDKLASYGLDTELWISQDSTIFNSNILALKELLQTKSEKISQTCAPMVWNRSTGRVRSRA